MQREEARRKLCFALDVDNEAEAVRWARELRDVVGLFKVGLELFVSEGPRILGRLAEEGVEVFLDLKLHDIPNTVRGAARVLGHFGVAMFNVHAPGGKEMMQAAAEGAEDGASGAGLPTPKVVAVTLLTSIGAGALVQEIRVEVPITDYVVDLALLAKSAGLDGVVASPNEVSAISGACGHGFDVVTPGIRPADAPDDDQQRIATPASAIRAGASVLVVGRPIRHAPDPLTAAEGILSEIASVA